MERRPQQVAMPQLRAAVAGSPARQRGLAYQGTAGTPRAAARGHPGGANPDLGTGSPWFAKATATPWSCCAGSAADRMVRLLRWLSPLSGRIPEQAR